MKIQPNKFNQGSEPEKEAPDPRQDSALSAEHVTIRYGNTVAVDDVGLAFAANQITAIIGPSGCGKSTFLRAFNRMNDFIPSASLEGAIRFQGIDIYDPAVDPVEVRLRIGMVFQKPNPFPKTIYKNVAWGPQINGFKGDLDELVENSLRSAAIWDEVKDRLHKSALGLSGGQQQRLCIARTLAMQSEVILMDEPCSALDPLSTGRVEDLMLELKQNHTFVIVTHNMQQASRASDYTAFMEAGKLVEFDHTEKMFQNPSNQRTEDYVSGRFG